MHLKAPLLCPRLRHSSLRPHSSLLSAISRSSYPNFVQLIAAEAMSPTPGPVALRSCVEGVDNVVQDRGPVISSSWLNQIILFFDRKKSSSDQVDFFETIPEFTKTTACHGNYLYLAYGSNLCSGTFRRNRGIKPLSCRNVVVPELELVFSVPGIPYDEPCFASTSLKISDSLSTDTKMTAGPDRNSGLKPTAAAWDDGKRTATALGWSKHLVGVVYEISAEDYAHIVATEGVDYGDVEVSCYSLDRDEICVPENPEGLSFKAHSLCAKSSHRVQTRRNGLAQPSQRYLNIIVEGAREHQLPQDYRRWLERLQPYTITSWRQKVGKALFAIAWAPMLVIAVILERMTINRKGKVPSVVELLVRKQSEAMWFTYDWGFRQLWGDGEATALV